MTNEELAAAIQAGDIGQLLQLWERVRRFAVKQAGRWCRALGDRAGVTREDLAQCAFLALMDAVEGWKQDEGVFLTWYGLRLKTAFAVACGVRTKRALNDPLQSALSIDATLTDNEGDPFTLADIIEDPAAEAAIQRVEEWDRVQRLHDALENALATLPQEQADALRMKYFECLPADAKTCQKGLRALRHPSISRELKQFDF